MEYKKWEELYDCAECKNTGYVETDNNTIAKCRCYKIRQSLDFIQKSGLEEALKHNTFANFKEETEEQRRIKSLAKKYVENGGENWLLLCGQSGSGKTHLCTAVVGELLKGGKAVLYLPYRDELPRIKSYILDNESYRHLMNRWQQYEVLYIDDLFKGTTTERDKSIIFELIDYRYRNCLKTIISTEYTVEELVTLEEATAGRILERSGEWKYEISKSYGKNYRLFGTKSRTESKYC